jgi:hypothetical protein
LAAFCCVRLLRDGRSKDPAADRLKAADFARRALDAAGDDPDRAKADARYKLMTLLALTGNVALAEGDVLSAIPIFVRALVSGTIVFLLYQKGRGSRIFQA